MSAFTNIEAAIELIKHPRFKWAGGMRTACGIRIKEGWQIQTWLKAFHIDDMPVPDLADPATKGCLLDLVRKLSKDDDAYVVRVVEGWVVQEWPEPNVPNYYETEGLALSNYITESPRYLG